MWNPVDSRIVTTRFDPLGVNSASAWQEYRIPKGAVALYIFAVGGGGGGGGGFGAAAGAARGGGGGGGSGAVSRLWIPAKVLPSLLWVQPGHGGSPGTNNAGPSRVSVTQGSAAAQLVLSAANGGVGGNGTGSAAGTAGSAGAIATATTAVYQNLGVPVWTIGQAGAAGGVHTGAVGASVTFGAVGSPVSGGAGGAGCTTTEFAGGNITGAGLILTISGGALGANPGKNGAFIEYPWTSTGGSGAGSSNTVAGASGGPGAPGSGGGGGGAGVTTGGSGGKGGGGIVLITAIF
jgi:hypothetical protein